MLELSPKTRLSWDFTVLRDGRPVAHLDMSGWHAREHLTVEGKPYRAYRDGMSRHHVLESDGVIFAHADKHEDARRRFQGTISTFLLIWGCVLSASLLYFGPEIFELVFTDFPYEPYGSLIIWMAFLTILGGLRSLRM